MNRILINLLLLALAGYVNTATAEEAIRVFAPESIEYKADANVLGIAVLRRIIRDRLL